MNAEPNFLQSQAWGKVNQKIGHQVFYENISGHHILAIIKDAKRSRYMEIPGGPAIDWNDQKLAQKVTDSLLKIAKEHRCVFIRIRPQLEDSPALRNIFKQLGFRIAPMHINADNTVLIDLKKSESELLSDMRRQTRYEVRRAEKIGIKVEKTNHTEVYQDFFEVQALTAKRQGFIPPSLDMLLAEREAFAKNITFYVAKIDEKPVAYALFLWSNQEADYFEAASTDLNRQYPGAYAIIWEAIKDFKKIDLQRLNLCGIAPKNQPHHRYAGITTFKTGFGGDQIEYIPAHDLVINKIKYLPDFIIETARRKKRHL